MLGHFAAQMDTGDSFYLYRRRNIFGPQQNPLVACKMPLQIIHGQCCPPFGMRAPCYPFRPFPTEEEKKKKGKHKGPRKETPRRPGEAEAQEEGGISLVTVGLIAGGGYLLYKVFFGKKR